METSQIDRILRGYLRILSLKGNKYADSSPYWNFRISPLSRNGAHFKTDNQQQNLTRAKFLGVLPFDRFPVAELESSQNLYSLFFVLNTDPSSEPGTHWLACYYDHSSNTIEFFDSYGYPPEFYNLHFPPQISLLSNQFTLQSDTSTVCGQYAIFFLVSRLAEIGTINEISLQLYNNFSSRKARDRFVAKSISNLAKSLRVKLQNHVTIPKFRKSLESPFDNILIPSTSLISCFLNSTDLIESSQDTVSCTNYLPVSSAPIISDDSASVGFYQISKPLQCSSFLSSSSSIFE